MSTRTVGRYEIIGGLGRGAMAWSTSRLASGAVADQILISDSTAAELGACTLEGLPPLKIKHRSTPLDVFNVRWREPAPKTLKRRAVSKEQSAGDGSLILKAVSLGWA